MNIYRKEGDITRWKRISERNIQDKIKFFKRKMREKLCSPEAGVRFILRHGPDAALHSKTNENGERERKNKQEFISANKKMKSKNMKGIVNQFSA